MLTLDFTVLRGTLDKELHEVLIQNKPHGPLEQVQVLEKQDLTRCSFLKLVGFYRNFGFTY